MARLPRSRPEFSHVLRMVESGDAIVTSSSAGALVSLLGLLLGVIQGHLKKSKQRQGQIENSPDRSKFPKPLKFSHLVSYARQLEGLAVAIS